MRVLLATVALICVGTAGCPDQQGSAGPVDTCEKAGQQCRMGGGKLGVCSAGDDQTLECASQH